MKFIVNVAPIGEPGQAPLPANLGFNTQVDAANPLSAMDKARAQLEHVFTASGLQMAPDAPSPAPTTPAA